MQDVSPLLPLVEREDENSHLLRLWRNLCRRRPTGFKSRPRRESSSICKLLLALASSGLFNWAWADLDRLRPRNDGTTTQVIQVQLQNQHVALRCVQVLRVVLHLLLDSRQVMLQYTSASVHTNTTVSYMKGLTCVECLQRKKTNKANEKQDAVTVAFL